MAQAKHTAAISLGIMGAGFVAAMPFQDYTTGILLQGGFEAGLVGGLADWFAVTALFRHPLGIPIPHTALLPRNRDKVIRSLISVVENEFLSKESIKLRLREIQISTRLLRYVEQHVPEVSRGAAYLSEQIVKNISIEKVAPFIENELKGIIQTIDSAKVIRMLVEQVTARGYEEKALQLMLTKVEGIVSEDQFKDEIGKMALGALSKVQMGGLMQFAVNAFVGFMNEDKLGSLLQDMLLSQIKDMKQDPNHPLRSLILSEIRNELAKLSENTRLIEVMDAWKVELFEQWDVGEKLAVWLSKAQEKTLALIQAPSFAVDYIQPIVEKLVSNLQANAALLETAEHWVQEQMFKLIDEHHHKIGKLVAENLNKLDDKMLILMIEEKVGGDLQWIRVNGAVCGFLIGVVLQTIQILVH